MHQRENDSFFLLFKAFSFDGYQVSMSPGFRHYPYGGGVDVNSRIEKLLYGEGPKNGDYHYGLIQGRLQAASYGTVEAGLHLYPISFLDIYLGKGFSDRIFGSSYVDCEKVYCKSKVYRDRIGTRMAFKIGSWVNTIHWTRAWTRPASADEQRPILDELENVLLEPGGEPMETTTLISAYVLGRNQFGFVSRYSSTLVAFRNSQAQYFLMRYSEPSWNYSWGIGRFESSQVKADFSVFILATFHFGESIALF